jgi:hypothetical protein
MADYHTTFSAVLDLKNDAEEDWFKRHLEFNSLGFDDLTHAADPHTPLSSEALLFYKVVVDTTGDDSYDFDWTIEDGGDRRYIWFFCEESGSPYQVACVVHKFLKTLRPRGKDEFEIAWANTCSKLRTDGFGGGMLIATRHGVGTCSISEQYDHCKNHIVNPWSDADEPKAQ